MTTAKLHSRYSDTIEAAIKQAKASGERVSVAASDGAEAYACPKPGGDIAWGVNRAGDGVNILRGIRRPYGTDAGVS